MVVASAFTDVLIIVGVGGLSLAIGMGVLLPWIRFRKALTDIRANWIEAEAEIVAYKPIPASDWPQWDAIYAFRPNPDRLIKSPALYVKLLNDKGEPGTRCTVLYNPKDARQFTTSDISGRWTDLLWAAPFLIGGLAMFIVPLFV